MATRNTSDSLYAGEEGAEGPPTRAPTGPRPLIFHPRSLEPTRPLAATPANPVHLRTKGKKRTYRCAAPFQLTPLPTSLRVGIYRDPQGVPEVSGMRGRREPGRGPNIRGLLLGGVGVGLRGP